jgi:2-oxoglutarate dehydrogenase E1 component
MAPKSLLRHPLAVSDLKDMSSGGFREVLEDPDPLKTVRRILFCSGKIYYELLQKRRELKINDIAIVRMEQFYPFPKSQFKAVMRKYKKVRQFIWVQEEPKNMGAWLYIHSRLEDMIGKPVEYVGRNAAASPATGFPNIYRKEQAAVTEQALKMVVSDSK